VAAFSLGRLPGQTRPIPAGDQRRPGATQRRLTSGELTIETTQLTARINYLGADELAPFGTGVAGVNQFIRAVEVDPRGPRAAP